MRWRAYFFLNPEINTSSKNTYGFNSKRNPPYVPELKEFEHQLLDLIKKIEFTNNRCHFQRQLKTDIKNKIYDDPCMTVSADKTNNYYKITHAAYDKLVTENITKNYAKADKTSVQQLQAESKRLATELSLEDRIDKLAQKDAFITMKDHKENFDTKPTCRLINPTKSELGKISKSILDNLNKHVISATHINQWKNTNEVLSWFMKLSNKKERTFICFDIVEFYPSITHELLNKALKFAEKFCNITETERNIIHHTKQSVLFYNNQPWRKKNNNSLFDITMGSYDGAECCELVGSYILSILSKKFKNDIGLYRDDGLAALTATPQNIERIKKDLCETFKAIGLRITIDANKKVINYLDVTLNLNTSEHYPYIKPGNHPMYVHRLSNHPPNILRNIPDSINKRLCNISSNQEVFNTHCKIYQKALQESGYNYQLHYTQNPNKLSKNEQHRRKRKITWYNPPFSKNLKTNLGYKFLRLIRKSFHKDHKLHRIFNTNTVKISYSCTSNIQQIIQAKNHTNSAAPDDKDQRQCNCRRPEDCPLDNKCLTENLIYQCTVNDNSGNGNRQTYIGLCETTFKKRFSNHKSTFNNQHLKNSTELSKHIWHLKENNINYNMSWRILGRAKAYSEKSKRCNLCILEKSYIIYRPTWSTLNKRSELVSSCRHATKHLLKHAAIT